MARPHFDPKLFGQPLIRLAPIDFTVFPDRVKLLVRLFAQLSRCSIRHLTEWDIRPGMATH
jgi:hypothetical protein